MPQPQSDLRGRSRPRPQIRPPRQWFGRAKRAACGGASERSELSAGGLASSRRSGPWLYPLKESGEVKLKTEGFRWMAQYPEHIEALSQIMTFTLVTYYSIFLVLSHMRKNRIWSYLVILFPYLLCCSMHGYFLELKQLELALKKIFLWSYNIHHASGIFDRDCYSHKTLIVS